jgi:hypothetical protein
LARRPIARPVKRGERVEGLRFRNGDVIRTVDGVSLIAARFRELLEPLAGQEQHSVELEREDVAVTLDFSIVD